MKTPFFARIQRVTRSRRAGWVGGGGVIGYTGTRNAERDDKSDRWFVTKQYPVPPYRCVFASQTNCIVNVVDNPTTVGVGMWSIRQWYRECLLMEPYRRTRRRLLRGGMGLDGMVEL